MRTDEERFENLYTTKRYLASLVKKPGYNHYAIHLEDFKIAVKTNAEWSNPSNVEYSSLVKYKTVAVELWEGPSPNGANIKARVWGQVHMPLDRRFKNFYNNVKKLSEDDWKFGTCYNVEINTLCELVMYIYKINKLSVFF